MLGPFPTADVLTRLKGVSALRFVGGAADLGTARLQKPHAPPAAYVVTSETAPPPAGATSGQLIQRAAVAISVVLFVNNVRNQDSGAGARVEMDALIAAVRGAVLNWTPDAAFEPVSFSASRDEAYEAGWLVVQEIYRTTYRLQVTR
jgi:hypothetical protein